MFTYLSNEDLNVEVAQVGGYAGSRFDWTGFITQVQLKEGGHRFCTVEKMTDEPLKHGGAGLCGEFGIFKPIGYEDAEVGALFPKPGVGLLQRLEPNPYEFHAPYPIQPFHVDVSGDHRSISYLVHPVDCRGYSFHLAKRIRLQGSSIRIDYSLTNSGSKTIETQEYIHNFIRIDDHPIGPGYRLGFSFPIKIGMMEPLYTPEVLQVSDQAVTFQEAVSQDFYCRLGGFEGLNELSWELIHGPSRVGMRETALFPVSMIAVWGTSHVVSPELFIDLLLEPGETKRWSRRFEFFKL
ncbi:hypothetical protein [Paenibacillus hexagrammi]|uniref:Aldose 1-epimerase n=1 Tax=Paenibacillus hexagrammi TaxID=2908839 RepID=A0ABY3SG72_9BACL|nr:hypothetical protein [Paenibacillus sp. YPD9-1]UJF32244.1 hypothetical protein L0M14_21345 [Paenibacillus sp. YPD9-1]